MEKKQTMKVLAKPEFHIPGDFMKKMALALLPRLQVITYNYCIISCSPATDVLY